MNTISLDINKMNLSSFLAERKKCIVSLNGGNNYYYRCYYKHCDVAERIYDRLQKLNINSFTHNSSCSYDSWFYFDEEMRKCIQNIINEETKNENPIYSSTTEIHHVPTACLLLHLKYGRLFPNNGQCPTLDMYDEENSLKLCKKLKLKTYCPLDSDTDSELESDFDTDVDLDPESETDMQLRYDPNIHSYSAEELNSDLDSD